MVEKIGPEITQEVFISIFYQINKFDQSHLPLTLPQYIWNSLFLALDIVTLNVYKLML